MDRRLRRLTIAGVAVFAAGATGVALRALGKRSPLPTKPLIRPQDIPALTSTVARIALAYGDGDPVSAAALATTRGRALAVVTPRNSLSNQDDRPVYLVVVRGRFTALSWQSGARPPQKAYLYLVLDPSALSVTDLSLSDSPPLLPLASLGTVSYLEPPHP